jgi:hypothetical protein
MVRIDLEGQCGSRDTSYVHVHSLVQSNDSKTRMIVRHRSGTSRGTIPNMSDVRGLLELCNMVLEKRLDQKELT